MSRENCEDPKSGQELWNDDGVNDLVVTVQPSHRIQTEAWLIDGRTMRVVRREPVGRTLDAPTPWPPVFAVQWVRVAHDAAGRPVRALIGAVHLDDALSLVTAINATGRSVGEYWFVGHVSIALLADVAGDGGEKLVVAARHEHPSQRGPVVAVLDPMRLGGFAPHPEDCRLVPDDAEPGSHLAYVVLPGSELSPDPVKNYVVAIEGVRGGRWTVTTYEGEAFDQPGARITYHLDAHFRVDDASFTDVYELLRGRLVASGELAPATLRERIRHLVASTRYWGPLCGAEPDAVATTHDGP